MKLEELKDILRELAMKRKVFVSENDFQFELAFLLKEKYIDAKVLLEYCPWFDASMHIDILVIKDDKWYPIELKYKTKSLSMEYIDDIQYKLKNQAANDIGCYAYLNDIARIEEVKSKEPKFKKGYTIFLTNDMAYLNNPKKENCFYRDFSLKDGEIKKGNLSWDPNTGEGTMKGREKTIELSGVYLINWEDYSKIDDCKNGEFKVLINEIK